MRNFLDDLVAGIGNRVDRMTKTDDDFLVFYALADIRFCFIRIVIALLNLEGDFIGATMLGAAQCTNRARDC